MKVQQVTGRVNIPPQLKYEYERGISDGKSRSLPWFRYEVGTERYWAYLTGYQRGMSEERSRVCRHPKTGVPMVVGGGGRRTSASSSRSNLKHLRREK